MKKLKNLIPAAELRQLNHLKAKPTNKIGWSSTYAMICCYKQIAKHIQKLIWTKLLIWQQINSNQKRLTSFTIYCKIWIL